MPLESRIARHLDPEFEPVALVWSDSIPSDTVQFKSGRFGCVLNLYAVAASRGRVAGGCRETIECPGARAALGLGTDLVATPEQIDHYASVFSKGLASARHPEKYREHMDAARPSWRQLLEYGERRHCSYERAEHWLREEMPRYESGGRFVLFKPLHLAEPEDDIRAVIFAVAPIELAGLATLVGSVVDGTEPIQVPPGADCFRISGYACAQGDSAAPRAVLGMMDIDGREVMRRRFRDDTMTLTLPFSLFERLEAEADDSVFQMPAWRSLRKAVSKARRLAAAETCV